MANNLAARYSTIEDRLKSLEQHPAVALAVRQQAILGRIAALAQALGLDAGALQAAATPEGASGATPAAPRPAALSVTPDASPTQQRLEAELIGKGCVSAARFVRVPADYYDQPLEFRRDCLGAASIDHLCKSIVMENTRAHESVKGWDDPRHSKYYCVIVQYTARLHADKLKVALCELGGRKFGRQYYNMRLAPEEVNDALTGYSHNAVSPIGLKENLPIILSSKITQLDPEFFWMGAGEVDLKVGMSVKEFIEAYQPFVIDCTYD
ncbi:hypothetical protein CHLRE_07g338250v5 [Chlamydomonas reinhardtii]|uniref:YbaK/aminoacyl-tRNA synthetase-associated domain-containing protein n=1 Tax=Chlamydomonas reinhardtii TaxID=3055 RepID=A8JCE5_CHLRE|nr:uncharacterized protein CHLRE_07g338250v5 [Chlamydomonas reinhardtii]PNW80986.1 hypothetical protein CHLRE_07g338250v5 [Chlamydomonas reinhardtii]|eukprot:XP_001700122.1 YbaK/prolyl-tRNA synthetase-like protein [Chlamydomonas reinhardtii]